jgi:hypothetical protein
MNMKIWGIIKKHKILTSWLLTFAVVVSVLGVSISPAVPTHLTSVGGQTKYEITIGEQVLAAGLSADYTCNGTNDNIVWAEAIAALPAGGGIVNDLTGGNYNFAGTVNVPANVTIMGIGRASYFSGATPCFTSTGNGTTYENLSVYAGGITTGATTGWLEINVAIGTTLYTERSPNSSLIDNTYTGNVSATTIGATTLNAPTGRTASYVIAASDATTAQKAQADYVCPTTDISPAIAAAITAIGANGIIHILPTVTATFGATVVLPDMSGGNSTITIEGSGLIATTITLSGNNDMFTTTGAYSRVMFKDMMVQGAGKAYSFFKGSTYFSTFQNLNIYNFGISGITQTLSDSSLWVENCHFGSIGSVATSNSGAILIGNGSSGIHIRDNEFDLSSRAIKFLDNTGSSAIDIQGNRFGSGVANGNYIEFESGVNIDILNNRFEVTPAAVTAIYCPATNSKTIASVNIQNNTFEAMTTLSVPIIDLVRGGRNFVDTNISNNKWDVANYTVPSCIKLDSGGQPFNGMHIQGNSIRSDSATVTNGFIDLQGKILPGGALKNNFANVWFVGTSPIGLLATPFGSYGSVGYNQGNNGESATPTSTTLYTAINDCFITSTGGGVSNIVIKDAAGNVMETGATTLAYNTFVSIGCSVTWTWTVTAPTVTVFGN